VTFPGKLAKSRILFSNPASTQRHVLTVGMRHNDLWTVPSSDSMLALLLGLFSVAANQITQGRCEGRTMWRAHTISIIPILAACWDTATHGAETGIPLACGK